MRLVFPTSARSSITQRCLLYLSKVYMMKNGIISEQVNRALRSQENVSGYLQA